jgi:hypothetical protein
MMRRRIFAGALLLFTLNACSMLPLDCEFYGGILALQRKFETFFTALQTTAGTAEAAYERHGSFYAKVRTDLAELQKGAEDPDVANAIRLIESGLADLERAHRQGITAGEIPLLRQVFATYFASARQQRPPRLMNPPSEEV